MFDVRHFVLAIASAVGTSSLVSGCEDSVFVCNTDEQCRRAQEEGVCQANGYCSFADASCPSGQRYGEHASKGLAETCVSEDDAAGSTSTTSESTSMASSSEGEAGEGADTSTSSPSTGDADDGASSDVSTTWSPTTGDDEGDTGTTGAPTLCSFEHDFEDGVLPPVWNIGGDLDVVVQDGMLGMELVSSQASKYGWAWLEAMDFSGRSVVVEIGAPPPASSSAQLLLELGTPALAYLGLIEGDQLIARTSTGGGSYTTHAVVPFTLRDARFLRMSNVGDAVLWEYSNGQGWESLHELPVADDVDLSAVDVVVVGGTWTHENEVGFIGVESVSICP